MLFKDKLSVFQYELLTKSDVDTSKGLPILRMQIPSETAACQTEIKSHKWR